MRPDENQSESNEKSLNHLKSKGSTEKKCPDEPRSPLMSLEASYPVSRGNFHNAISHIRTWSKAQHLERSDGDATTNNKEEKERNSSWE